MLRDVPLLNERPGRGWSLPALGTLALGAVLALAGVTGAADKLYTVQVQRDIAYYQGADADKVRHKLDLYLPEGRTGCPVVLFVHGGGWIFGDKNFFGIHAAVGKMFARHGVVAVLPNYRLSPKVKHPEHIKDVARAFAWAHKNIKKYGGRPDQMFLCGHSAGGHLVALLATDESYLKAEGLTLKAIKGVMPISGVYSLPDNFFNQVFGKDAGVRKLAAPLNQVRAGCPPFLIIYADRDFPFCDAMSRGFCKALQGKKVPAEMLEIKKRNHLDIITRIARDDDPCARAVLDFIAHHTGR